MNFGERRNAAPAANGNGQDRDLSQIYRAIHARITSREADPVKMILFAASYSGEGCSTISGNLALCLARMEKAKVLLLELNGDTDIEDRLIKASRDIGLNQVVAQEVGLEEAIQPIGRTGLHFLARGGGNAGAESPHEIDSILTRLKAEFSYVIIDGPPVSDALDFADLLPQVDGVVLVIEANRSRRQAVATNLKFLQESGARVLGAVLNKRQYFIPDWLYGRL